MNWEGKVRLVDDGLGSNDEPVLFERGDKVTIELGYDEENFQMFEGFITDIDPDSPVKITCQDMMWYLGQIKLDLIYATLVNAVPKKVRTVGAYLAPLISIVNSNFELRGLKSRFEYTALDENGLPETGNLVRTGGFRYPDTGENSVAGLLKELKSKYDVYFYFRNNVLQVDVGGRLTANENVVDRIGADLVDGLKSISVKDKKVVWPFHFQKNVINQDLTYVDEKSVPLQIEVSGSPEKTKKDTNLNEKLTEVSNKISGLVPKKANKFLQIAQVQFSNLKGAEVEGAKTIQRVNFSDLNQADLLLIAKRIYNNVRYTGFKGSFTTFGQYPTKHGDIALLTDTRHPERNGAFMIKGVNTTFGMGGYRQQISLERNVSSSILK